MKTVIDFVTRHPFVVVTYAVYLALWEEFLRTSLIQRKFEGMDRLTSGDGLIFMFFLIWAFSLVYFFIVLAKAIFGAEKKLYGTLAILIIFPAVGVMLWGHL